MKTFPILAMFALCACSSDPSNGSNNSTSDMATLDAGSDVSNDATVVPDLPPGCWFYDQDVLLSNQAEVDLLADAPCFAVGGELTVTGPIISLESLSTLKDATSIRIVDTNVLDVSFPELTSVDRFKVAQEDLDTISVPQLGAAQVIIIDGPATTVDFASLRSVETLHVTASRLTNFEGFAALQTIANNLLIKNNDVLFELTGLEQIGAVGGSVSITNNASLSSLTALTIGSVGSSFILSDAPQLASLEGLDSLTAVPELLAFSNCDAITDLSGLQSLQTVGELWLHSNDALDNLAPFPTAATRNLQIRSNGALRTLFSEKVQTGSDITLSYNAQVTTLEDLDVGQLGDVMITGLGIPIVLDVLTTVEDLSLISNASSSITLSALTSADDLNIESNASLTTFSAPMFDTASTVEFDNNDDLITLTVPALSTASRVLILRHADLTSVSFPSLGPTGDLVIGENRDLTTLSFPMLTRINDDIEIYENGLVDLTGLSAMTEVNDRLHIRDNSSLTSFDGLEGITEIDELEVLDNVLLTSITGLSALTTVSTEFRFQGNLVLLDCLIDDLLAQLGGFNGTLVMADNGGTVGCP